MPYTIARPILDLMKQPRTLSDVLEVLAKTRAIPEGSKAGIRSSLVLAVRYALREPDRMPGADEVMDSDIRELIPVLHVAAREYARAEGHQSPGDQVRRVNRIVEALTGGRTYDRNRVDYPCPAAWHPLLDAIPEQTNRVSDLGFLARCCVIAGAASTAPARMPSVAELRDAAHRIAEAMAKPNRAESQERRLTTACSTYRRARACLLDATSPETRASVEAAFGALPKGISKRTSHLGADIGTMDRLEAQGHDPAEMTPEQMFRVLAPELAADYDYWVGGPGKSQSATFKDHCIRTLLRVAGWAIRAGRAELLSTIRLDDLFYRSEEIQGAMALNPRLRVRSQGNGHTLQISLLEYLAESEAAASLARSTVTADDDIPTDQYGRPWFTAAIWANCSRIWTMTSDVYGDLAAQGEAGAARWGIVSARWGRLQKELSERQIPPELRVNTKDKVLMIRTVTLPQLVCLGLPLRRREIHDLRRRWIEAREAASAAGHADPSRHPAAIKAEREYYDAAWPFAALTLALDDGLRRKQYTHGRLGAKGNFRLSLSYDVNGQPDGIEKMTTWWTGDRRDPAHLKIVAKDKTMARREDRDVRWGYVDRVILWDLVSHWRPRQLVDAGALPSIEAYNLEADVLGIGSQKDVERPMYALFATSSSVRDCPVRSRTELGDRVGRELHYIVKKWIRPDVPAWSNLGTEWRSLWAIHILRLLNGSYWGGARGDWETAKFLTMDTEETLRADYAEIDQGLRDRLGLNTSHWEHLRAYDRWMDRLYFERREFDPLEDPDLPVPPHLRDQIEEERTERATRKKPRIRRARPGQAAPGRAEARADAA